ncbi:hypothetical protein SAMN05421740_106175 [Parapedobacter koreensis]|uniref:Uncharacterized protein n=1 Tax=Parapedobacter koreensis TaxID=332977 RepID=A0A1H7QY77_9SPHI|nr:hypothetical protein SAMN05421740_106175 [Parapedobacter koreensis]
MAKSSPKVSEVGLETDFGNFPDFLRRLWQLTGVIFRQKAGKFLGRKKATSQIRAKLSPLSALNVGWGLSPK